MNVFNPQVFGWLMEKVAVDGSSLRDDFAQTHPNNAYVVRKNAENAVAMAGQRPPIDWTKSSYGQRLDLQKRFKAGEVSREDYKKHMNDWWSARTARRQAAVPMDASRPNVQLAGRTQTPFVAQPRVAYQPQPAPSLTTADKAQINSFARM